MPTEVIIPFDRLFGLNVRDSANRVKIDEMTTQLNFMPTETGEQESIREDSTYSVDTLPSSTLQGKSSLAFIEKISAKDHDVIAAHIPGGAADDIYTIVDAATPIIATIGMGSVGSIGANDSKLTRIDDNLIFDLLWCLL